jgi:adenosylcobinamide-phosphate synthase
MVTVLREYSQDFWALGALPLGVALDLIVGKPKGWPHPNEAIQRLIAIAERGLRVAVAKVGGGPNAERLAGLVLTTVVVGLVGSLAWLVTDLCHQLGGPATLVGRALLIYWGVTIRAEGKKCLLDDLESQRACVESIGSKANDATIAPLFWLAVAGPAGLWAYRAISELVRKVGFGDARSLHFGRASAQLDDFANLVPVRLTWLSIALSAALLGEDGAAALRIGWRDGRNHPCPNVGWGEATLAGALGIQLCGRPSRGGIPTGKTLVGDPIVPMDRMVVRRAARIARLAGLNAVALAWAAGILFFGT